MLKRILIYWLVMRIGLSVWAALCSMFVPLTDLEKKVGIWPPGESFIAWLTRLTLSPWDRWDVEYFYRIAAFGYRPDDGTLTFHPLFPMLGRAAGWILGGNYLFGLFLVANLSAIFFLIELEKLIRLDLTERESYRAVFYFPFLPAAMVIFAPYTEPLFLLCSVASIRMARERKWWLAGLFGGLASLTRQQGVLLLVPLAWEFWEANDKSIRIMFGRWKDALGLALTPLGLLAWTVYRSLALSDVRIDWRQPQTVFYGLLVSPSADKVVPGQRMTFPWEAFRNALGRSDSPTVIDLASGIFFLLLLAAGARLIWRVRPSYLIYTLVIFVISFSLTTGTQHAYLGLPRHVMVAFPLILPFAVWGKRPLVHWLISGLGTLWLLATTSFYVFELIWLP